MRDDKKHNRANIRTAMINWFKSKKTIDPEFITKFNTNESGEKKSKTSGCFCQHSRLRRFATSLIYSLTGKKSQMSAMENLCPICGLRPVGSLAVEYLLSLHFWDGTVGTYTFRGRPRQECYRIHNGIIEVYMLNSTISYALDSVSIIDFAPREIHKDSPEVLAAQSIIAGKNRLK